METAFILDAYPSAAGIVLWLITEDGRRISVIKPYKPRIYFKKTDASVKITGLFREKFGGLVNISDNVKIKKDVFLNDVAVIEVVSNDTSVYKRVLKFIRESGISAGVDFFNMDIPAEEMLMQDNGLFPFCKCIFNPKNSDIFPIGKQDELFYEIPALTVMEISPEIPNNGDNCGEHDMDIDPAHMFYPPALKVRFYENFNENKEELFSDIITDESIEYFKKIFKKYDPDVIVSSYGDSFIIRRLMDQEDGAEYLHRENFYKENISSNSLTSLRYQKKYAGNHAGSGRTYFSYGRTLYKSLAVLLKGRLHIDRRNSFFYGEAGLDGIIELSRLSAMPVQRLSRTSPGTVITAIETAYAISKGILVPYLKTMPEDFKTLSDLIKIDKGGLTYRPITGFHENVAECDFVSMYPSIIVNYNLSYETINCPHKECNTRLPFTGYKICSKNIGIVPAAIKSLIERRNSYKKFQPKNLSEAEIINKRRTALKWLLVVCFGYLGYKNAKFGRIESHEATTALGRELFLTAKDAAEDKGFKLLHGLTDCIWISKKDATPSDYETVVKQINDEIKVKFKGINAGNDGVGFNIALEGIYKWIVFLSSKESGVGVSNRFYGLFNKSEKFKIRGIELRRKDMPAIVKTFQAKALEVLSGASNFKEFIALLPAVESILEEYIDMLNSERYSLAELVVRKSVSVEPLAYSKRTDTSEVAQTLLAEGKTVNQGARIDIIYVDMPPVKAMPYTFFARNPVPVDIERYTKMLKNAADAFLRFKGFC